MVSTPSRCNSITTSLPSSPEPRSMTLIAEELSGVPMRMWARLADSFRPPTALSVFGNVHQLVLGDPGHHGAQLGADFLDGVRRTSGACRLERRLARLVLQHPVARELAGLDVVEHALHFAFCLGRDDAR